LPAAVASPGGKPGAKDTLVDPPIRLKLRVIVQAVPLKREAGETLEPRQPKTILIERPPFEVKVIAAVKQPGDKPSHPPADWGAALKLLAEELALCSSDPRYKGLELSIDADRVLRYGYVMAVREVAETSGFKKIGFNAPR